MRHPYILIDMTTQRDFLDADGGFPVVNRPAVVRNLRRLFGLAQTYHLPVISAVDSHRENEPAQNGFPQHCVEGTPGQKKPSFTLLQKRIFVEANNSLDLPANLLNRYRQVVFRRRTSDLLDNPKADRLLTGLQPELFVVFGVGLERSIRRLILCLLARGRDVGYIPEACGYWNETDAELSRRQILAKGGCELQLDQLDATFKEATRTRIRRIFSKPPAKPNQRRSLAG